MSNHPATVPGAGPRTARPSPAPKNGGGLRRGAFIGAWIVGTAGVAWLVAVGLMSARPVVDSAVTVATPFTLPATDGSTVSLESFRGSPVLLYFSEGAGCDSCIIQMAAIEQDPEFADAGIVVLPIVMNRQTDIMAAMMREDVVTPFLMDDGTISDAYGTLGTGMHANLPGHGFVLINADGEQVWSGNYPSMWIAPEDLFQLVEDQL